MKGSAIRFRNNIYFRSYIEILEKRQLKVAPSRYEKHKSVVSILHCTVTRQLLKKNLYIYIYICVISKNITLTFIN